jgi:hypothetical protein
MTMVPITKELLVNLAADLTLLILSVLYRKGRVVLERLDPLARPFAFMLILLVFFASNIAIQEYAGAYSLGYFITSTCIFGWVLYTELEVFWLLGLIGGDRTIAGGVNYKRALDMSEDSLEFLGIGAGKLIAERETFRKAIARCHRDQRPVRFLLCPPDSERLINIARRAGRPISEYQETVRKSLSEIREMKVSRSHNIEVRFYADLPLLRLMFINDKICLTSHYILGEGSGAQLPQLHVLRKPLGRRDIESLYYPLRQYYEQLWEKAEKWDFEKYL